MNRFILLLAALLMGSVLFAQNESPYSFNWKREGLITGVGMSTFGTSLLLKDRTPTYSSFEVAGLNRARINAFDRVATYNYDTGAGKLSDHLSLGSKLLPLAFLAGKKTRNDFHKITLLYAETFLVANGLTTMTKTAALRTRPYVFNENVAVDDKLTESARYSFFSGHTSKTAAMTFFTAKVYNDYYPESKWRPVVWTAAAAVPALTGYLRVKAGKHYPTDVAVGYAVGALTGVLVPHLHKKVAKKKFKNPKLKKLENLKVNVGMSGANLSYTF